LPDPDSTLQQEYVSPTTETEKSIVKIWQEVLGIDRQIIGQGSDFFFLGGNSLTAVRSLIRIHETFGVNISLTNFFEMPTINGLKWLISNTQGRSKVPPFTRATARACTFPVTPSQKGLFLAHKLNPSSVFAFVAALYRVEGNIDLERLRLAARTVVNNNDSLHSTFDLIDGVVVQKVNADSIFDLQVINSDKSLIHDIIETIEDTHFRVTQQQLFSLSYITTKTGASFLYLNMPHIAADGFSVHLIIDEIIRFYTTKETQFKTRYEFSDFATWYRSLINTAFLEEAERYWFQLPAIVLNKLKSPNFSSSVFSLFLSSYFILLKELTNSNDIRVGVPLRQSSHKEFNTIVGLLTETVVIRYEYEPGLSISELVKQVNRALSRAIENGHYPIGQLIQKLSRLKGTWVREQLMSSYLNYERIPKSYEMGYSTLLHEIPRVNRERYPVSMDIFDYGHETKFSFKYQNTEFDLAAIERIFLRYVKIIEYVLENPARKVGDILTVPSAA
jgi:surfactin family lipopeptide synthetase A